MKKAIVGAAFAVVPFLAFAGNTITFTGQVDAQTCTVSVNGNAAGASVLLPTVSTASLATAGKTDGMTNFTVGVTGCTADTTKAMTVKTKFVANQVTATGNIQNVGTAKNVSLQLLDPNKSTAGFNLTGGYSADSLVVPKGQTEASYDFAVRYYAEAAGVTAGTVKGSVQYALEYQ
jgi:major type 1 subunit fimbrin (pilin)